MPSPQSSPPMATVNQLRARWPDMPAGSDAHAQVLLADASALVEANLGAGATLDPAIAVMVVCQMVRRAMASSALPEGATSISQSAGPFTTALGFSSPGSQNALYLTRAEKKLLGAGRQRAFTFDLLDGVP